MSDVDRERIRLENGMDIDVVLQLAGWQVTVRLNSLPDQCNPRASPCKSIGQSRRSGYSVLNLYIERYAVGNFSCRDHSGTLSHRAGARSHAT